MKKVAISIGGSILSSKSVFDVEFAKDLAQVLGKHKDTQFTIATGGGRLTREAVAAIGPVAGNKYALDNIAIATTRLHAMMLRAVLDADKALAGEVHDGVPESPEEVSAALVSRRIVVHGGFLAGITTDSCATLSAEATGSKLLVNVSETGFIYDKDPKKNKDAKPLRTMGYDQLVELAGRSDGRNPGSNFLFDVLACKLIKRSGIKAAFVGRDLKGLDNALKGIGFEGTLVG